MAAVRRVPIFMGCGPFTMEKGCGPLSYGVRINLRFTVRAATSARRQRLGEMSGPPAMIGEPQREQPDACNQRDPEQGCRHRAAETAEVQKHPEIEDHCHDLG